MNNPSLNELAEAIHAENVERGFYDRKIERGTQLMLIVSELSEALEADRKERYAHLDAYLCNPTPENFQVYIKDSFEDEISDALIRLLDMVGYLGIDIEQHVKAKRAFNKTRGYKHGKKY